MSTDSPDGDGRLIGRLIAGKLRIVEHLGSGSMGRVYRAHHMSLDKDVAIKVLRESAVPDPNRSRRFAREARAASRLNHPNSVAVLDFGEDGEDKLLYIAMEFLEGEDLQTIIDRGSLLGVDRICHIMIQVLAALAAAHDAGIIHRDMKPSNVVLVKQRNDEGQLAEVVKVCDFGVAKFSASGKDTLDGGKGAQRVIGTPLYMSPEQAVGDTLDPRTDVYSCGVIMYEMLTGQPPFTADTPMGVLMKHVSEPLRSPSTLVPGVPIELEAVIRWALEKNRKRRPSTARDLRNALRAFLAGKAGTIPALTRYGVEATPDESPWDGPTPYWQLDMPAPPRTGDRPLLPAPPLPSEATPKALPSPEHLDLVADLELQPAPSTGGPNPPHVNPASAEPFFQPPIEVPQTAASTGHTTHQPFPALEPTPPLSAPLGARDPEELIPNLNDDLPHRRDEGQRTAPPSGAQVPRALRGSSADLDPTQSPWDERSEIFSEQSFFQMRRRTRDRVTMDLEEIRLEAPPPRSLSRADDTDPKAPAAARDGMATYLWERFALSPERRSPPDGFWLRDAQGREVGPLTWSEITQSLRMEASYEGVDNVSISSDQQSWIAAERFVELTGVEAILKLDAPLPSSPALSGSLDERSVAAVFGQVSQRAATGRLVFRVRKDRRNATFDIYLYEGRPTFVATNEPQLQLPNLLVVKGILPEDELPRYIRVVLSEATTLEEAVSRSVKLDVASYRAAVMKERLRHLLRWPAGDFALTDGPGAEGRMAFAPSLLSLLPDLVYRTLSGEQLESELADLMDAAVTRTADASARLADMGLTRSQRGVAERLLNAQRLRNVLPPEGRIRKAYTTMAYVLRETGLLEPA